MLGLMRRHSRSIFIKFVYVGIILSFVIWGFGSYQGRNDSIAVSVNGSTITFQEYQRSFENLYSYYREQLKDRFTEEVMASMNLQKKALDSLIDRILTLQEAKRMKLTVNKGEVSARIQSIPAFQNMGAFDNDAYFQVLSYNKLKPRDFEEEQKTLLLMEKAEDAIKKNAVVSEDEILKEYKREKATVNIEFIKISPRGFEKDVKPTTEEIQDYFSSHMGEFTIPEKIRLGYAIFEPKDFFEEIKLTKEDYEDYYNSYISDFTKPAQVRASHILVKFDDDREKAREAAKELLAKAKAGEDFSALAEKYSADTGSAKKGGDLGFFGSGTMLKPFEDAAFSMNRDEISDLVETVYGFHIIKVAEIKEEEAKPLADVKGEIKKILEAEISAELAEGRADDIYYEAVKGRSLKELAAEEKIPYKETAPFTLDNVPNGLQEVKDNVQAASKMDSGWIGRPFEVGKKIYILTLIAKEEPRESSFEEAKEVATAAVIREKSRQAAIGRGEKILAEAKGGTTLKKLANMSGLKVEETGHFSRARNIVPKMGISQEIVSKAFELTPAHPLADAVYSVGEDTVIFSLKEIREIDQGEYQKEKELFRTKLLEQRREEVYRKWLKEARGKAVVEYHEDLADLRS